jgi:murein DD-endopeptidase MepM/ murein hydrolase activator NlpD
MPCDRTTLYSSAYLWRSLSRCCLSLALCAVSLYAETGIVWPTPNPAFQEGKPIEDYIQPTASGKIESGLFGCVRNDGARFHEGIDLFPLFRDRNREARDPVYAVLAGRVAYINNVSGHSSYGRYIIVEHPQVTPAIHTLYAHLRSIDPALSVGTRVDAGTPLGVMGRSAGGYSIPRERAHLHFEIGFRFSDQFQRWFDDQNFGSRNHHGLWNGMNLVGIDPLDFYSQLRSGKIASIKQYLELEPVAAILRIHQSEIPDFIIRYPALLNRVIDPKRQLVAWDIHFTWYGLPLRWDPLYRDEGVLGMPGNVQILRYNRALIDANGCRRLLSFSIDGRASLARYGETTLAKLFSTIKP